MVVFAEALFKFAFLQLALVLYIFCMHSYRYTAVSIIHILIKKEKNSIINKKDTYTIKRANLEILGYLIGKNK